MSNAHPIDHDGPPQATVATAQELSRVLEQFRDGDWTARIVEKAAASMTGRPVRVEACRVEYCKVKPNRDINLALAVRLRGLGDDGVTRRFSCTVFPDDEQGRAKFAWETGRPVPDPVRRRLQAEGFDRFTALLSGPAMVVRVFPVDPLLPGLAAATDVEQMTALLAEHLERCQRAGPPTELSYEILHYKPCRSCMVHYTVGLNGAAERATCRVYGKVYRDEHGARCDLALRAAWEACRAGDGTWRVARPVAYVAPWRLLLQEAVCGPEFRQVFGELTHDDATEPELRRAERLLSAVASAIRAFQSLPLRMGPRNSFTRLYTEQEHNLAYLKLCQPALAEQIAAIRAELARLEPQTEALPRVFCHGDFAHGNVIIEGDAVGIVDLDKVGSAEPVYDVAYFLTHMWSFGVRHPRRRPHVERLWRYFREAYLALAPDVPPRRLALYEALDFAAYVLRNFRKQSHQANWLIWAQGQVEAAWERLEEAAGTRGGQP